MDKDCYEHDLAYARGENELDADWKFFKNSWSSGTNLKHKIYGTALGLKSLIGYEINQEIANMAKNKNKKVTKKQLKKVEKKVENKVVRQVQQAAQHRVKYVKPKKQKGKLNNLFGMTKHIQAPVNVGTYSKFKQSKNIIKPTFISGTFNLFTINNNNSAYPAGTKIYSALVDENFFTNARVGIFFHLFEQWGGSVSFEYVSSSATSVSGNLIMAIDPDAGDPERNDDLSTALIQMVNPVAFPPWVSGARTQYSVKKLWCNNNSGTTAEKRQTALCRLYISNESTLPASSNDYGFIRVHYKLRFWKAVSEPITTNTGSWAQWIMDNNSANWSNTYNRWDLILNNATKIGNATDYTITPSTADTSFILGFLNPGEYFFSFRMSITGATGTASALSITPSSGINIINAVAIGDTSSQNNTPASASSIFGQARLVVLQPNSSVVVLNAGGALVSNTDISHLSITRIGNAAPLSLEQQIEQAVQKAFQTGKYGKQEQEDIYVIPKQNWVELANNNNNNVKLFSGSMTPPFRTVG